MSIRLMSIVWDIPWPSQSALLVALKLADYANDEGGSIHPSRDTLAKHAQASLATVKRILGGFRDCGLLKVVEEGGKGPRSTTRYEFDVRALMRLHDGYDEIQRDEEAAEKFVIVQKHPVDDCGKEGAHSEPLNPERGSIGEFRGSSEKISGSIGEPRNTTLDPPSRNTTARAREDFSNGSKSEVQGRALPSHTITANDPQWEHWIVHLRNRGRDDLALRATAAGAITTVGSRWPKDDSPLPFVKQAGLTERSTRMTGENSGG